MYISVADPDLEIQEAPAARSSKRGMGEGGDGEVWKPLYLPLFIFAFLFISFSFTAGNIAFCHKL